jgi:RPM1-interacting protein 4
VNPISCDEQHHRVASVPKFGAWDELDPKSGEGFTVIFNKVKEEKQIAASQNAAMRPTQSSYYSNAAHGQGHGRSSYRSKVYIYIYITPSDFFCYYMYIVVPYI